MSTLNDLKTTISKVKDSQSKWGLTQTTIDVNSGDIMRATTINGLIDELNKVKTRSGWGGTVSPKVSVGDLIRNILASLNSEADAIKAHCPCNCNHCSCNCNHCSCHCNHCKSCSSQCDNGCDSSRR